MKIIIEGELEDVKKVHTYSDLPMIDIGQRQYYVAEDEEAAGKAARKRWEDMAHDDPKEFIAVVGEEQLINWALGNGGSLEDFLDERASSPEEEFAGYDGNPLEASVELEDAKDWEDYVINPETAEDPSIEDQRSELEQELEELVDELGFTPTIAYRCN